MDTLGKTCKKLHGSPHTGSIPVLTTKNKIMKIRIDIHLTEWHLIPFKTALGFTWLCFDVDKY